jgi:hypothetical protein
MKSIAAPAEKAQTNQTYDKFLDAAEGLSWHPPS